MEEVKLSENLHIQCQPSRLHVLILILAHAVVLFTLALLSKQFVVYQYPVYLAGLAVLLSANYFCRIALHFNSNCIVELDAKKSGDTITWKIELKNGDVQVVKLKDNFLVWRRLVICQFYNKKNTYSLVLLPDSVSPRAHRHTRIYLSLYGVNQSS